MKTWTQVTATLEKLPEDWAAWHEVFEQSGIHGTVVTDSPASITGYAYEPTEAELSVLIQELQQRGATTSTGVVHEEDWAESWKQFFKPRRIGKRFVVRPTWEEFAAGPEDLEIVLDPGQAFGTGDHPTTRMCLMLLEDADLPGKTVADVGCGSGILSVGACLLGAESVKAGDIEENCVESAIENAERNQVTYPVVLSKGFDAFPEGETYDIILSNIISAALIMLAPEASRRVKQGGDWIVSGVIHSNWPDVLTAANRVGFELKTRLEEDDWVAAHFTRL
jgi:ribosomal protein L11 methyltransferase